MIKATKEGGVTRQYRARRMPFPTVADTVSGALAESAGGDAADFQTAQQVLRSGIAMLRAVGRPPIALLPDQLPGEACRPSGSQMAR